MLHRLDRDGAVAGRVDAERGELAEIDGLAVIGDHYDVAAFDRNTLAGPGKGPLPNCHIDLAGSLV